MNVHDEENANFSTHRSYLHEKLGSSEEQVRSIHHYVCEAPFIHHKWLCHLFNGLVIIISVRKKLKVVCFNLPNITQPQPCL